MAISREEVEQIAAEVAKRVVTPPLVCACGYNAIRAASSEGSLQADIRDKNKRGAMEKLSHFLGVIFNTEVACHLELNDARRLVGEINSAIEAKDWSTATYKAIDARISIQDALHEASRKQEG